MDQISKHKILSSVILNMMKRIDKHADNLMIRITKLLYDAEIYETEPLNATKCPHLMSFDFRRKSEYISDLIIHLGKYLNILNEAIETTIIVFDEHCKETELENYDLVPSFDLSLKHLDNLFKNRVKSIDDKYERLVKKHTEKKESDLPNNN